MQNSKTLSTRAAQSLVSLLRDDFIKRCRKNGSFSLRSYAQRLGIDQSLLSKILRGQRKPSAEFIRRIGGQIGLSDRHVETLTTDVGDLGYHFLKDDEFEVIQDWYHFAILELMKTNGFQGREAWIAKRLGLHIEEVRDALDRLQRLKIIENKNSSWQLCRNDQTWANITQTTWARKNLQRQLTQKALEAIDQFSFDQRQSGSLTVACSSKLLPEIKKRMQKFRRELDEFIAETGSADEVYQLVLSFFPLTKSKKKGEQK